LAGYTNDDVVDLLESEGVYAVQHYTDGSTFEDGNTRLMWQAARSALEELENYLTVQTGREL
jgi:hypothetical protein